MVLADAKEILASVIQNLNTDPEAALAIAAIEAAAVQWDQDFSLFSRYRRNLKERHADLRLFDHALDEFRRRQREQAGAAATLAAATSTVPAPQPWHTMVDGARLLEELTTTFTDFLILPEGAAVALALWVIFTHAIDCFDTAPRLAIASPTKRCGKTTLIKLLALLCRNALASSNITPATVFRVIDATQPSLLIDEADTFMSMNSALRGILNAGHDRGAAFVYRTIDGTVRRFSTFAAIAVAAIGRQPPTWRDRAIEIAMNRMPRNRKVQRLTRTMYPHLEMLASKAMRWAADNVQALKQSGDPVLPDGLDARAKDNWSVLISIADICGADWGARAREIALNISRSRIDDEPSIELLSDIREIFRASGHDKLSSEYIVQELQKLDHQPWREQHLTQHKLGTMLTPFEVHSHTIRTIRLKSGSGKPTARGFDLSDFEQVFAAYLDAAAETQRDHGKQDKVVAIQRDRSE